MLSFFYNLVNRLSQYFGRKRYERLKVTYVPIDVDNRRSLHQWELIERHGDMYQNISRT